MAQYVTSIVGVKEDIEFIREKKDGSANTGCLLKEIRIKSKDGRMVKKITLEQEMLFTTGTTIEMNGKEPWHYVLKAVRIGDSTAVEKEYGFDYYKPSGTGASPDYWNYYVFRRKTSDQRLFIPIGLKDTKINAGLVYQNSCYFDRMSMSERYPDWRDDFIDRSVDVGNQKSFSLRRITFPTGGYTEYEYEPNRFQPDSIGAGAAGQRVKKITSCTNPDEPAAITVFEYGQGVGLSMYDEYFLINQPHTSIVYDSPDPSARFMLTNEAKIFSTNSSRGNIPADAFNVRYSEVTTRQLGRGSQTASNGKTVSTYDIKTNYTIDGAYLLRYNASGKPLLSNRKLYNAIGTLLQEEAYGYELTKTDAYNNVYVDRYIYFHFDKDDEPTPRDPTVTDYATYPYMNTDLGQYSGFYFSMGYNIFTGRYLPTSKTTTLYSNDGNVTKSETYSYNNRYQLTGTSESTSLGMAMEKQLVYPTDGSWLITKHNMYNAIQQEITKHNDQEIKRIRYNYPSSSAKLPLPESVDYSATGESGLEREHDYLYDQANGNLIQYTDRSGIPVSYLWGYNGAYPVLQVAGDTYANVISRLSEGELAGIRNGGYTSSELHSVLAQVRSAYQNQQQPVHVSSYSYIPLVGLYQEVGPDGLSTSYRYDKFGRLRQLLDHNKNVVKQYSYHYANQASDGDTNVEEPEPEASTDPWWVETGTTRCEQISMATGGMGNSGKIEHKYVDENPNSTSYNTKKWEIKSAQVNTNSCPATYEGVWSVIDDKAYFVQPYRSYNDGRNMKYTLTVYYQLEPIPGQPSHIISEKTITAYPFQGVTGTQGWAIDAFLGEQDRYHSHTVTITQE